MIEKITAHKYYQKLTSRIGLHVAASFVFFAISTIVFVSIADEVRESETLPVDEWVLLNVHQFFGSHYLDIVMPVLTDLGGFIGIAGFGAIAVVIFLSRRQVDRALFVTLSVGGAVVLNALLKLLFERPRPDLWQQLVTETSFSFPSGHAMASSALALSIVVALWATRYRYVALATGIIYMLFIGFSRLYLGVHYPTDIIGGWTVSSAWVAIVYIIFGELRAHHQK